LETAALFHQEAMLSSNFGNLEADERKFADKLLERGDNDYITRCSDSLDALHSANVLAVAFTCDTDKSIIATGSTDKTIKIIDYATKQVLHVINDHEAAIIALDWNPKHKNILLSGSMDKSHCVIDAEKGTTLQRFSDHGKYVVAVKWAYDGLTFATASHDHTAAIYRAAAIDAPFTLVERLQFNGNVEALVVTKSDTMIFAVRDDNYLHFLDLKTMQKTNFNMNSTLDDHVSFTAMDISVSPDEEFILVTTDRDRSILYKLGNSTPVRNFWGATNDTYSHPRGCFHPSGKYVYSTSQDNRVYCWEVSNQTIVTKLEGHKATVRDLKPHPTKNMLATSSFDKTVKLWTQ